MIVGAAGPQRQTGEHLVDSLAGSCSPTFLGPATRIGPRGLARGLIAGYIGIIYAYSRSPRCGMGHAIRFVVRKPASLDRSVLADHHKEAAVFARTGFSSTDSLAGEVRCLPRGKFSLS